MTIEQEIVDTIAKRRIIRMSARHRKDGSYVVQVIIPSSEWHPPEGSLNIDVSDAAFSIADVLSKSPFAGFYDYIMYGKAPPSEITSS